MLGELLRAHAFWTDKRLTVDLVVLNEAPSSAVAALGGALQARIRAHLDVHAEPGAKWTLFTLRGDQIAPELHAGLLTAARIVLDPQRGTLAEQVDALHAVDVVPSTTATPEPAALARPRDALPAATVAESTSIEAGLEYFNGYGGFDDDGREFVTIVRDGRLPPMPWPQSFRSVRVRQRPAHFVAPSAPQRQSRISGMS